MTKHICSGPFLTWDSFPETLWIKYSDPRIPDFHSIPIIEDTILFKLEHETSEKNMLHQLKENYYLAKVHTFLGKKRDYIKIIGTYNVFEK